MIMVLILKYTFILLALLGTFLILVNSQDPESNYCFQFTWVGPNYDNSTAYNHTCEDLNFELCTGPLVTTYDLTPPNTTYLWEVYNTQVACRLSKAHVCAKYTFSYNGAVEYITYFCTKVTIDGEGTLTDGCMSQNVGSYTKEICACKSYPGQEPCNSSLRIFGYTTLIILSALIIIINGNLT